MSETTTTRRRAIGATSSLFLGAGLLAVAGAIPTGRWGDLPARSFTRASAQRG